MKARALPSLYQSSTRARYVLNIRGELNSICISAHILKVTHEAVQILSHVIGGKTVMRESRIQV